MLFAVTTEGGVSQLNRLTFDVEDWYHSLDPEPTRWTRYESRVVGSTLRILDLLDIGAVKATFFALGHVAKTQPDLIREIHHRGHEVASHGMAHRFVYDQAADEFRRDVATSIEILTAITGTVVRGYRAPYFSITARSLWALDILHSLGIIYDSSIFPVINHRYGIPTAPRTTYRLENGMVEYPVATVPLGRTNLPVGGGIYFRILPYRALRRALRSLNNRGEEFVFYLHPWECDPAQPRLPVPISLGVRHYWALGRTLDKLASLLTDFRFAPLGA
jgi:polysaccharide deacetylase family protein (PEP-CTERM system associated)